MTLISHRGAKSLAPENSIEGIKKAAEYGVEFIEFDVQRSKDNELVLFHNQKINNKLISQINYDDLLKLNPVIPKLEKAIEACGSSTPLLEIKSLQTAKLATNLLQKNKSAAVTSFLEEEIIYLRRTLPKQKLFLMQHRHPFGLIKKAKMLKADGVGINKNWALIVPFYYFKAKRNNLEIYSYTINNKLLAGLFNGLMPKLYLCTDNPKKLANLRVSKKISISLLFLVTFLVFFKLGFSVVAAI